MNTDNLRLKGSLMSALASAHWKLSNQKQAISYMEEDLAICRSLGDQHGECRVIGKCVSLSGILNSLTVCSKFTAYLHT